jgi:hypothetical protein
MIDIDARYRRNKATGLCHRPALYPIGYASRAEQGNMITLQQSREESSDRKYYFRSTIGI